MAKKATKRENGEGYVEKMKSGNYACTIYSKYIDPNTLKYKKIKRTMPTEKEAIAEAKKALKAWETAYIENTTYKEGMTTTFGEYVEDYLKHEVEGRVTQSCIYSYTNCNWRTVSLVQTIYRRCEAGNIIRFRIAMQTKSADRTYSCILAFCNCALKWFSFPEAKHLFLSSNLIDFHKIANEKTCLFVDVSDCDFSMSALINLFFSQLIQTLIADANEDPIGRLPISTRIILDDFGANIKIKDFDKLIAITRSRDIQLSVVLQSISQLETNYGKSQQTSILNNFDHVIFLGGINDYESAKFIAARVAKSEETVLSMPRDKEIIISSGHKAIYVDKLRPYEEDFDISKYLGMEI